MGIQESKNLIILRNTDSKHLASCRDPLKLPFKVDTLVLPKKYPIGLTSCAFIKYADPTDAAETIMALNNKPNTLLGPGVLTAICLRFNGSPSQVCDTQHLIIVTSEVS